MDTIVTVTMNPAVDVSCSVPDFAAGQVNKVVSWHRDPGGKGINIARLLRHFQLPVTVTGFLGRDNARIFETLFRECGLEDRFVRLDGETRIGIKVHDSRLEQTTDINFPGLSPDGTRLQELFDTVVELAGTAAVVVLAGSLPGSVPPAEFGQLVGTIRKRGAEVVVDTSGPALRWAIDAQPTVIKPNDAELSEYLGRSVREMDDLIAEAGKLADTGIRTVIVSLGGRGALFVERGQAVLARPPRVRAVSTVGAGDAMTGGMIAGMMLGLPLTDRARLATALAAATVTVSGPCLDDPAAARQLEREVEIVEL